MYVSMTQRAFLIALASFALWSTATTAEAQQIKTVFVIAMENHNLTQPASFTNPQQILGNAAAPFLNSLMTVSHPNAAQTSFARNYQNVAPGIHPSAPNYIWSQGGSNFGVLNDNDPFGPGGSAQTTSQNLSNYLQTAGIAWKSYQEDIDISLTNNTVLPNNQWTVPLQSVSGTFASGTNAYNGSNQYGYDVNHDPQVYFTDTNGGNNSTPGNPLAHNYAPLQQLQTDLAANTVAQYNWITPNQYNDAHSSLPGGFTYQGVAYTSDQAAVAQGDNFLSIVVPLIQASQAYKNNGVIIIWFDETEGGDTPAYTLPEIVISPLAKGNAYSNNVLYTHSSDLLTSEEIFGVGPCIGAACSATDLSDLFQPVAISTVPTLTSISPASGAQGASVNGTLTGDNFVSGATVNVSTAGVTSSNVVIASATQITATLNISATAPVGNASVTVTTMAGTSGPVSFNVIGVPTLTSISPSTGSQGSSVPVTLTGTNFVAPLTVNIGGTGTTVSNVVVVSSTSVTANLAVAASAGVGQYNVSVTTSAGTSGNVSFSVTAAGSMVPTLTSITPSSGSPGTSVNVTLTGTNFTPQAGVRLAGASAAQGNVVVVNATTITATFTLSSTVATGPHNVYVVTSAGNSNIVPFTVVSAPPPPTLTSISPATGAQGASVKVTLTGTNFVSGATVNVSTAGVTTSNVVIASATQITATLNISATAPVGNASVTVTTMAGTSGPVSFNVIGVPTLTSISPSTGSQGSSVPVTLTGTNFVAPLTVNIGGTGITVSNVVVVSSTSVTANLAVATSAGVGQYNVSVTTSAGTSGNVSFSVTAAGSMVPTLTSITPSSGSPGTSVNVTLTGTNFTPQAGVRLAGAGAAQGNVVVVNATTITATFTLSSTVATGPHNVYVVTSAGNSNIVPFTVN